MNRELKEIILQSSNIVFFGGAGVSTESNIPDFRSEEGLYRAKNKYGYSPEQMLSHSFYKKHTNLFFKYYKENMIFANAQPNDAHISLAKLEKEGRLKAVVTQNIDGLHQKAGSVKVHELHGSVHRNYCERCGKFYDMGYISNADNCEEDVPHCTCGAVIKPDVVLYEEPLNENTLRAAISAISKADTLIVGGTSLLVYPAAQLIDFFQGKTLVLINKTATPYDSRANLLIYDSIGKAMKYE